jgi:redox-regulated HSP33 family molecular chaperone
MWRLMCISLGLRLILLAILTGIARSIKSRKDCPAVSRSLLGRTVWSRLELWSMVKEQIGASSSGKSH